MGCIGENLNDNFLVVRVDPFQKCSEGAFELASLHAVHLAKLIRAMHDIFLQVPIPTAQFCDLLGFGQLPLALFDFISFSEQLDEHQNFGAQNFRHNRRK